MVEMDDGCPFCEGKGTSPNKTARGMLEYDCSICGRFSIAWEYDHDLRRDRKFSADDKKKVSVVVREWNFRHSNGSTMLSIWLEPPTVELAECYVWQTFEDLEARFPNRVSARCDRALGNLAKISTFLGEEIDLSENDYPILFALDPNEMRFMAKILEASGLVSRTSTKTSLSVGLSATGWDRVADLEESGRLAGCKQAFIAMSFNDELRRTCDDGIKAAITATGYTPMRIDEKEHNKFIPDEIISEIRRSRFLVADMTGQNHGVYFEAGFALGLGRPVIWTCHKDQIDQCHFDTKQISHILWENAEDLRVKLVNRIRATIV